MNRFTGVSLAVAGSLLLVACGSVDPPDEASGPTLPPTSSAEATEPTETTEPTPTGPARSPRGNIIKALGEEGGLTDQKPGQEPVTILTFAVDSIAPVECTEPYAQPPENGHMVAVTMRFSTAPELATASNPYFSVSPVEFSFIGPDNITVTNLATIATFGCLPQGEVLTSDQMMPGSQYVGKIVLDLPATTGTLVYRPSMLFEGGWEWSF
jgi:hypothetical protein